MLLIGLAGILISLLVFMISYRRTIGSRKERIKAANRETVTILARTIANSQMGVDEQMVQGVIRSKAREHNASVGDLNNMFIILEDVMTKYIENEFISEDVKNKLVEKVKGLLAEKKEPETRIDVISDLSKDRLRILMSTFSAMIAMVTVLVVYFGVTKLEFSLKTEFPISLLLTMSASIVVATLMAFTTLALDRQKRIRNETIYRGPMLKEIVLSTLREYFNKSDIEQELLSFDGKRIDFVVKKEDENIPVEVKYMLDSKSLPRAIKELQEFIARLKAKKGLLIINTLASEKDKKTAVDSNIIIIENALSKKDIIRQLKNLEI